MTQHLLLQRPPPPPGHEDKAAHYSHHCRPEVKITCGCMCTPPYAVRVWCLFQHSDNFAFRISYTFQISDYIR
jgi:hypothetical protein